MKWQKNWICECGTTRNERKQFSFWAKEKYRRSLVFSTDEFYTVDIWKILRCFNMSQVGVDDIHNFKWIKWKQHEQRMAKNDVNETPMTNTRVRVYSSLQRRTKVIRLDQFARVTFWSTHIIGGEIRLSARKLVNAKRHKTHKSSHETRTPTCVRNAIFSHRINEMCGWTVQMEFQCRKMFIGTVKKLLSLPNIKSIVIGCVRSVNRKPIVILNDY